MSTRKKSVCKHKLRRDIRRGTILLELRWFQSSLSEDTKIECVDLELECEQCRLEAVETQSLKRHGFYEQLQISQIAIPIPSSYQELQQKVAILAPNRYGLAIAERPDGSQVTPSDKFEDGEVIIFREIRPALEMDGVDQILSGNRTSSWEDAYEAYCNSYRK